MTITGFFATPLTSSPLAMLYNKADDVTAIAFSCDVASLVASGNIALDKLATDNVAEDAVIGVEFCLLGKKEKFPSVGVFS